MTARIPAHALDPAGGSPGQVPTINAAGTALEYATPATGGGAGIVETVVAGTGIAVDSTDPANPVVSATGGGGGGGGEATWTAPTLTNGWVNSGSGFNVAGYRKDGNGIVHLRGLVKSGTLGNPIFTLPMGYRPPGNGAFAVPANGAYGQINVKPDGTVTLNVGSVAGSVSIEGITFYTD